MDWMFVLLHIMTLCSILLMGFIIPKKKKTHLHFLFILLMAIIVLSQVCSIIKIYHFNFFHYNSMLIEIFNYSIFPFLSTVIILLSHVFRHSRIQIKPWQYILLLTTPVTTVFVVMTNNIHHLFFVRNFGPHCFDYVFGPFFYFFTIYTYACVFYSIMYLIVFSFRSSPFVFRQAFLFAIGMFIPLVVNILSVFMILPNFSFEISYFGTVLFTWLAIIKYDFLNIIPIGMQKAMDTITDKFVVIDGSLRIVDYNKPFYNAFQEIFRIRRNVDIVAFLKSLQFNLFGEDHFTMALQTAIIEHKTERFELHLFIHNEECFFVVETTPILARNNFIGTLILFKDITEQKKYISALESNQDLLIRYEKMASLGEMIGETLDKAGAPLRSLMIELRSMQDLINEYQGFFSNQDFDITVEDHDELANEMEKNIVKMRRDVSRISEKIIDLKQKK